MDVATTAWRAVGERLITRQRHDAAERRLQSRRSPPIKRRPLVARRRPPVDRRGVAGGPVATIRGMHPTSSPVHVCRRSSDRGAAAAGFTLIEMMTAVVVMAVLLAVAAPGLAGFVQSSRVNAAQSELVSSMMLARSEAAKRGQDVRLVGTDRFPTDFSAGWLVWWDANGDGVVDSSPGSVEVIRRYAAPGGSIIVRGTVAGAAAPKFAFTGFLSPATAVTFKVCDTAEPARGYSVLLQPVGLADIQPFTDISPLPACR